MPLLQSAGRRSRAARQVAAAIAFWLSHAPAARAEEPPQRAPLAERYAAARRAYEFAQGLQEGRDRTDALREAGRLYRALLAEDPTRDEAPEAAVMGSAAYRHAGDLGAALELLELLVARYGTEELLDALAKAGPSAQGRYLSRVASVTGARQEIAMSRFQLFDFKGAALAFEGLAESRHVSESERRTAARNAVILDANLGDDDVRLAKSKAAFDATRPNKTESAEVDYLFARATVGTWKRAPDAERAAKLDPAVKAIDAYLQKYETVEEAAEYVVAAAHDAFTLQRADRDKAARSCKRALKAADKIVAKTGDKRALPPDVSEFASECAYFLLDAELSEKWDYETGHHHYQGRDDAVRRAHVRDFRDANDVWFKKLAGIIDKYKSPRWAAAVRVRQASLYDSIREGLAAAVPGAIDRDADLAMLKLYIEALVWVRHFKVEVPETDRAKRRLKTLTRQLGNAALQRAAGLVTDLETRAPLVYVKDMFAVDRGALPESPPSLIAAPLPVTPGEAPRSES